MLCFVQPERVKRGHRSDGYLWQKVTSAGQHAGLVVKAKRKVYALHLPSHGSGCRTPSNMMQSNASINKRYFTRLMILALSRQFQVFTPWQVEISFCSFKTKQRLGHKGKTSVEIFRWCHSERFSGPLTINVESGGNDERPVCSFERRIATRISRCEPRFTSANTASLFRLQH